MRLISSRNKSPPKVRLLAPSIEFQSKQAAFRRFQVEFVFLRLVSPKASKEASKESFMSRGDALKQ